MTRKVLRGALGLALALSLLWSGGPVICIHAQVQEARENTGAAAAWQALLRLQTTATVLHTTAHPDDEDGGLLTWLSRGQGVRTGLLTLTRGEGGANLIGPELFDALGILRTEELLAAGRYYHVDQFFTRVTDFGFSKRLEETLAHWGSENVLRDMVRVIRLYRPDVIVSRFHGQGRDGHGHHQAAGVLSRAAFRAAADPHRFPAHFAEGLRPWQVKKLYLSVREHEVATVQVDTGAYNPLMGRSYRDMASVGLSHQRSQGARGGRTPSGSAFSAVQLVETTVSQAAQERSLLDGLDTSIVGMAKLAGALANITADLLGIQRQVETAITTFDARQPWTVMPQLTAGLHGTRTVVEKVRAAQIEASAKEHLLFLLGNKEREFVDAANKALGLSMEVLVVPEAANTGGGPAGLQPSRETFTVAIPGQTFPLVATIVNRSQVQITPESMQLRTPPHWTATMSSHIDTRPLGDNGRFQARFEVTVPTNAEYTRPYWSRGSEYRDHIYTIQQPAYLNLPFAPPDVIGVFTYQVDGIRFTIDRPAHIAFMDPPWGEQRRLLTVAPALSVEVSPGIGVIPVAASRPPYTLRVTVLNNVKGTASGKVRLRVPAGWTATPSETPFTFTHEGEMQNVTFRLSIPRVTPDASYKVQAVAEYNGKDYTEGYRVIAYRDLEPRHLYRPATAELRGLEVKVAPGLKVGYIMGVGDDMPSALQQIGVRVQMLGTQELAAASLDEFDAIIVGIRASAVRDDYKAYNRRLLDYVEKGGNLIVQYQTQEYDGAPYGPYPHRLGRAAEVSEEDAKVTVLEPANPIFNWPNKITPADFDNWVEERGSKWMSTWDERYHALLESHDREQAPQRGGMLQVQHGRGTYTYAAYAFYRQLPAGVPGAYRLFANMISLGKRSGKSPRQ
jgi:LmbE family N-acetylglucosaminyl deacetylase